MTEEHDLGAVARSIIDKHRYMTLGTADADGLPWASPVWYAPRDYREFFWVSSPEARHSRNLAVRPERLEVRTPRGNERQRAVVEHRLDHDRPDRAITYADASTRAQNV